MEESPGRVEIAGVSETRFNARLGTLFFRVRDARLSASLDDIVVLVNNERVPDETLAVSSQMIAVSYVLAPGLNELSLVAYDDQRRLLSGDAVVWAGANVLIVDVVDADLNPLSGVEVTARLANARAVQATAVTVNGTVRFENLPEENVALEATHPDGGRVRATARRGVGSVLLRLDRRTPRR